MPGSARPTAEPRTASQAPAAPTLAARLWQAPALPRLLPFGLLIAGIALDSALGGQAAALPWDLRWDYAARSLAALLALVVLAGRLGELQARPRANTGELLLAAAVGAAVFLLWVSGPMRLFSLDAGVIDWHGPGASHAQGSGFTPLDAGGQIDWALALSRLAGSALVVPLAEELFWRSLVMRWLEQPDFLGVDPRRVSPRAWLLQALAFGLEHDLWLAGILAGLAYGWLYRHSGRLWPAILAHGLTNGLLGAWVLAGGHWAYW